MGRRSLVTEDDASDIDLSSMIDCIFILLIFFIVTTVFVEEKGVQVAKPDAAASASLEENESLVLEIAADGVISFEEREVAVADIPGRLASKSIDADTTIAIRAHEKVSHGTFIAVWDAAKQVGAHSISFSTVN